MRAVIVVIRTGRNQFDRVVTEDRQFSNVLLPHRYIPCVVGVGLWAISKLLATYGVMWGRGNVQIRIEIQPLPRHMELPQKVARAEDDAAVVSAGDRHA